MKKLAILLMVLLTFILSCGNSNGKTENDEKKNVTSEEKLKIKVGTEGIFPPFTFADNNGKLTGYDIEVVEEIAKRANIDVEFVTTPWDSMFLGLESKRYDMIANQISKQPEREEKYIFSEDYLVSAGQLIVKKGRTDINSLEDLKGKKVMSPGVGSNYNKILVNFDKNNEFNLSYYEGNAFIAFDEVASGKVDATLHDRLVVSYFMKERGEIVELVGETLETTPIYFVFRKDSEELKNRINNALDEIKKDGTLSKISEKWFGADYTK